MRFAAATTLLLVVAAVAGCGGKSFDVTGRWQGTLTQAGQAPFMVTAVIPDLHSPGSVHYRGIDCSGRWTYLGRAGDAYRFREVIDEGRSTTCKGTGSVTLVPKGPDHVGYEFRGGGIVSRGTLARQSG